jgi:hypothetical protein
MARNRAGKWKLAMRHPIAKAVTATITGLVLLAAGTAAAGFPSVGEMHSTPVCHEGGGPGSPCRIVCIQ